MIFILEKKIKVYFKHKKLLKISQKTKKKNVINSVLKVFKNFKKKLH